jgi:hypothetical protein
MIQYGITKQVGFVQSPCNQNVALPSMIPNPVKPLKNIRYFLHLGLIGHSDDFDPKSFQFTLLPIFREILDCPDFYFG